MNEDEKTILYFWFIEQNDFMIIEHIKMIIDQMI